MNSAQIGSEDLRRFHGQLHRGLLMHRKGRLNLFYQLQFGQASLPDSAVGEVVSQLDLLQWFVDVPPQEIAEHACYEELLEALQVVMGSVNIVLVHATQPVNPSQFSALIAALHAFDRCAFKLDSVVTNSLTDVDALTGLFNRAALDRDLSREVAKARRSGKALSVAMIDADKFKGVNDTHGHSFGDVVLSTLAERFMESLRPSDLLYRYGGEEFVVLLPDTAIEQALTVLERLRARACAVPISKGDISVTQCVSVGLALVAPNESPLTAVSNADKALYSAKSQGRNRVVAADSNPGDVAS